jgi:hypothetical protein
MILKLCLADYDLVCGINLVFESIGDGLKAC